MVDGMWITSRSRFKVSKFRADRFAKHQCSGLPKGLDTESLRAIEQRCRKFRTCPRCKPIHAKNIFYADDNPIKRRAIFWQRVLLCKSFGIAPKTSAAVGLWQESLN